MAAPPSTSVVKDFNPELPLDLITETPGSNQDPSGASDFVKSIPNETRQLALKESEPSNAQNQDEERNPTGEPPIERQVTTGEVYSVFTVTQKKLIVLTGSLAAFFSPMSSAIYFPALNTIANDLHVSNSKINLSVTTFVIVQGVAPMMIAGFSDNVGRRPAYVICFVIYIAANLGLSLQNSYAALMVLRALQSAGSSGTVALANGLVGDLVTSSERGIYVAFASLGSVLGPSLSPIIGGLLSQYCGWHWIFWFLFIFSAVCFVPLLLFLPETGRKVVGDGSIPPPKWNTNLTDIIRHRNRTKAGIVVDTARKAELRKNYKIRFPNPLSTLVIVADKESALILFALGLLIASYYGISTSASSQFSAVYGFSDVQIGLAFLPIGVGGLVSAFTTGRAVDWNYRRHAKLNGFPVMKNKHQDLLKFPIERARLEIAFPLFYLGAASTIAYAWVINYKVNLAGPIILLFFIGYALIASFSCLNILMIDIYPGKPATATAASNLVRCELGAAASAAIVPMINAMGRGWAITLLALIFVAYSPALFVIMRYGMKWRKQRREREEKKLGEKEEKRETKEVHKQEKIDKSKMEAASAEDNIDEKNGQISGSEKQE
ncbi:MAG: hypothetical protein M1827_005975 [Pycnora praestabilis]|nr:MAG: hypothetical protein M1827_005975 [Pycnora praestabilis]